MKITFRSWTALAAGISFVGAAIHVLALFGGASWYAFFHAPPQIVESAKAGTLLAPVSAIVIAVLMAMCGTYALSAGQYIVRLPLLKTGLLAIGALCLLRGLLLIPAILKRPDLVDTFEVVAALVWALAGIGFVQGFRLLRSGRHAVGHA